MNAQRRQALEALKERADELRNQLTNLQGDLESARDEEQEYRDNMPESFADGEKGEKADAAISAMEDALSSLDTAIEELNSFNDFLDAAKE